MDGGWESLSIDHNLHVMKGLACHFDPVGSAEVRLRWQGGQTNGRPLETESFVIG
jgi:hypothetical protein